MSLAKSKIQSQKNYKIKKILDQQKIQVVLVLSIANGFQIRLAHYIFYNKISKFGIRLCCCESSLLFFIKLAFAETLFP